MPSSEKTLGDSSLEAFLKALHEDLTKEGGAVDPALAFLAKADTYWLGAEARTESQDEAPFPRMVGRFRLMKLLGEGGFGKVYLAEDTTMHRQVALKLPHSEKLNRPELRKRFLREARAAAVLAHPHIVSVFDAGECEGQWYLASQYCQGPNLAQWLDAQPQPSSTIHEAAQFISILAEAMAHAHSRGVVHRDLKPSNILLTIPSHAEAVSLASYHPMIADFGLAKLIEESAADTRSGMLLGTLQYMAPEQAELRNKDTGPATDIYALGLILYELLTHEPLVPAKPVLPTLQFIIRDAPPRLRSLRQDCPSDLETICLKCLEKQPRQRYVSAEALRDDLQRFLNGESIAARPVGTLRRLRLWARREPVFATALLFSLITLLLITVSVSYNARQTEQSNERYRLALERTEQLNYLSTIQRTAQWLESGDATEASLVMERYQRHIAPNKAPDTWEWRYLWNRAQQAPRHYLWYGHQETPYTLAVSPDAQSVVAADGKGGIIIRNVDTGDINRKFQFDTFSLSFSCYSKDGRYLAVVGYLSTGSKAARTWVWDTADWSCFVLDVALPESITTICFHPKHDSLLVTLAEGELDNNVGRLVEWKFLETQTVPVTLTSPSHCQGIFWSSGLKSLILVTATQFLLLDDRYQGKTLIPGPGTLATDTVVSPNGQWLAWADISGRIHVYDLLRSRTQPFRFWHAHDGRIRKLAFNPENSLLASCGAGNLVQIWDFKTGERQHQYQAKGETHSVCFHPDGKSVLFGSADDNAVHRWFFRKPVESNRTAQLHDQIWSVSLTPDGRSLVAGLDDDHSDQTIRYIDLASGKLDVRKALRGHQATVTGIVPLSVPDRMVTSSIDGELLLWDTQKGQVLRRTRAPDNQGIRFLVATDKGVAASGQEGWIDIWDAELQPCGNTWYVHGGKSVPQIEYDHKKNQLLSAGCDGKVIVWDFSTRQPIKQFEVLGEARCLALSHDGKTLAYGAKQGIVYLADMETGKVLHEIRAHSQPVCCMTFTHDDRSLISAGFEGEIKCWQVSSGEPLFKLAGHQGRVFRLVWNQDGSKLYSTGYDGRVVEHDFHP